MKKQIKIWFFYENSNQGLKNWSFQETMKNNKYKLINKPVAAVINTGSNMCHVISSDLIWFIENNS